MNLPDFVPGTILALATISILLLMFIQDASE